MADTCSSGVLVFVSHLHPLFVSIKTSQTVLYCKSVAMFIVNFYPTLTPNFVESRNTLMKIAVSLGVISLAFGIKSALIALQLQEWARAYVHTPNVPRRPRHWALTRLFSFLGVGLYNTPNMAQLILALHISAFALFGGLAMIMHTIDTNGAIVVDVTIVFVLFVMLAVRASLNSLKYP
jgi:succinate-acetate transporter protein